MDLVEQKKKELLIGCGHQRVKVVYWNEDRSWHNVTTLDINPEVGADVVWDLNCPDPLPFSDNEFIEIHAYEVLEHVGTQGDARAFFKLFEEFHRILAPNGTIHASVPTYDSIWAWGDPSHTRIINEGTLTFLDQDSYKECGVSSRTDFRYMYKADFALVHLEKSKDNLFFVLRKK